MEEIEQKNTREHELRQYIRHELGITDDLIVYDIRQDEIALMATGGNLYLPYSEIQVDDPGLEAFVTDTISTSNANVLVGSMGPEKRKKLPTKDPYPVLLDMMTLVAGGRFDHLHDDETKVNEIFSVARVVYQLIGYSTESAPRMMADNSDDATTPAVVKWMIDTCPNTVFISNYGAVLIYVSQLPDNTTSLECLLLTVDRHSRWALVNGTVMVVDQNYNILTPTITDRGEAGKRLGLWTANCGMVNNWHTVFTHHMADICKDNIFAELIFGTIVRGGLSMFGDGYVSKNCQYMEIFDSGVRVTQRQLSVLIAIVYAGA